jgi:hypothetical protein
MEPEIARRCQTCGAAVRGAARFCPQCGRLMADEGDAGSAQKAQARSRPAARTKSALVDQAERVANSLSGRLAPPAPEAEAPAGADGDVLSLDDEPAAKTVADEIAHADEPARVARPDHVAEPVAPSPTTQDAPAEPAPVADEARAGSAGEARGAGRVRRATAAVGAGLGESVRPRVEKLREASVVVFDEAAEDPGMRFVVIAALLFFVALLILLFSFVLR